jgi:HEAT repeat protein
VRLAAAEALVKLGSAAVESLIAALKDVNEAVRSAAAEALGKIGDVRAIEPLIAALKDSGKYVRGSVENALKALNNSNKG